MLPKLVLQESLILEDHLKDLMMRAKNEKYNKIKGKFVAKSYDTPFGNFPKNYGKKKIETKEDNLPIDSRKRIVSELTPKKTPLKLPTISSKKPLCGAFLPRDITISEFRRTYDIGDFPFKLDYQGTKKLIWTKSVELVDYHHYLPIFFDGLREKFDPYRYFAIAGTFEMIEKGSEKLPSIIPQLIIPLKMNMNTRDQEIIRVNLMALQRLVLSNKIVGQILVPYYRQLLPIMNLFKNKNSNLGDKFDYSQRKNQNIGDIIDETLQILETCGGDNAFINIKYMIPTYESCVFT